MPLGLKFIVYGNSGTGKTVLAGSANLVKELQPVLLCDLERGAKSIESQCRQIELKDLGKPVDGKIDVVQIKKWSELTKVVDFLYANKIYKTVILDSLTETNYLNLDSVLSVANRRDAAQIQDYGKSAAQMRRTFREFRDLDHMNVIITCLATETKDEKTGVFVSRPALTGKLVAEIPALVDVFGFYEIDRKENRVIHFQPSTKWIAKDRTEGGSLGDEIVDPTMQLIMEKINGKKGS